MVLIGSRYSQLQFALEGLNRTGIPLVQWANQSYGPAGFSDDQGLYYFVPFLVKHTGIPLDPAIKLFIVSLIVIGLIPASFFFWKSFSHWLGKVASLAGLSLFAGICLRYFDVYLAQTLPVLVVVPFLIWWDRQKPRMNLWFILFLFFAGLLIGYSNFIRAQAGTGTLLFLVLWLLLTKVLNAREKMTAITLLILFTAIPYAHFKALEARRDAFLTQQNSSYRAVQIGHPFWHAFYLGFGYLKNNYGIEWDDMMAWNKARSIDPKVQWLSEEYGQILKGQVYLLIQNDPWFVLRTVLAKMAKLAVYLILFVNAGWFFLWRDKLTWRWWVPFAAGWFFYAAPGFLVMPFTPYVLGFCGLGVVFGIWMIGRGLDRTNGLGGAEVGRAS